MVGFIKRFAPCYRHVAEVMADTDRFGTPMAFRTTFAFSPWTDQLREDPPRWQGLDEDTVVIEAATSTGSGGQRDLYQRGFVGEVAHFLTCVADGRAPRPSARDNIATMELCERLLAV